MSSVQPVVQPVTYSTGVNVSDALGIINSTLGLHNALDAAQTQAATRDTIIRVGLTIAGILIAVSAVGMIAREEGPGLIAETVKGVIEGEK